jgi:hypothetical protein
VVLALSYLTMRILAAVMHGITTDYVKTEKEALAL